MNPVMFILCKYRAFNPRGNTKKLKRLVKSKTVIVLTILFDTISQSIVLTLNHAFFTKDAIHFKPVGIAGQKTVNIVGYSS